MSSNSTVMEAIRRAKEGASPIVISSRPSNAKMAPDVVWASNFPGNPRTLRDTCTTTVIANTALPPAPPCAEFHDDAVPLPNEDVVVSSVPLCTNSNAPNPGSASNPGSAPPTSGWAPRRSRAIEEAANRGYPVDVSARSTARMDPNHVWASSGAQRHLADAKKYLPEGTVACFVNGAEAYVYSFNMEGSMFEYAIIAIGRDFDLYVTTPDISNITDGKRMHEFHTLGKGKICAPHQSIEQAFVASYMWAAAWNEYSRSGNTEGFRLYDK